MAQQEISLTALEIVGSEWAMLLALAVLWGSSSSFSRSRSRRSALSLSCLGVCPVRSHPERVACVAARLHADFGSKLECVLDYGPVEQRDSVYADRVW
jgi:hypothetical protein